MGSEDVYKRQVKGGGDRITVCGVRENEQSMHYDWFITLTGSHMTKSIYTCMYCFKDFLSVLPT